MPGLVELLEKSKTDLEIIQYSFTESDNLYLESEPDDHPILLTGDCFFEKQATGQYHLIAVTNYTLSNNFLPLLAQLIDEDIALAEAVEFIQEKPFATWFKSKSELALLLNLTDTDADIEDLDNEDCAPDSQISCKWPHGSSASPGGMFNQLQRKAPEPASILDIECLQEEETKIADFTAPP